MKAWLVTEATTASKFLERGTDPRSYWTNDQDLVAHLADDHADPVVLEIETDDLDAGKLGFSPDHRSIAEPASVVIGKSVDDVLDEWDRVPGDGDWLDSVSVVCSFMAAKAIPAMALSMRHPSMAPGM